ncbi:Transcriptional regulator, GntR family [[Clostridium] ultunense Esp]|uniref:GntR family transcriptional regulator n=1 Tax=Thermicanus aegyptius TaxID=94009 RepID=UPI0002B6F6EE|nr:GntR family transcriptional regulator [Thermicanus aegyptius]CCQ92235.1 Transcriptional regulator, GntR family [[Clostridium] ultunense Esp]
MERKPMTRTEWVYEQLKEAILSGKIAPGERLVVDQLARELGTSPIPVRETLRRLEAEGWVESKPFVGARVSHVKLEELEELFTIRLALEPILARTSVKRVTQEAIEELERLVNEMDESIEKNNPNEYSRLNYEFHRVLYDFSPWKELHRIVTTVWEKSARSRWVFVQTPQAMMESQKEHREMIKAIIERDEDKMERWMRTQKERAFKTYISTLKQTSNEELAKSLRI